MNENQRNICEIKGTYKKIQKSYSIYIKNNKYQNIYWEELKRQLIIYIMQFYRGLDIQ